MSIPIPNKVSREKEASQNIKGGSQNFISISSDELSGQNQQQHIREQEQQYEVISRSFNAKEQARKMEIRKNNILEHIRQIDQQQKENAHLAQQMAAKVQKRKEKKKMEQQLKKEFPSFSFLPLTTLSYLKGQLANFGKYCSFEQVEEKQIGFVRMRQQFRKKLTKGMMISLEEIRLNIPENQQSEFQRKILSPQADGLKYCYTHASELQRYFFTKICKKHSKDEVRKYQEQIQIVLREYCDKNNFELRRNIINEKVSFRQLATATDQSLKCQKTKQQERERLEQFVRQNTIHHIEINNNEPEYKPQQPQMDGSMSSFGNLKEPMDVQPKQTVQEINMRKKNEMLKNLPEKYRKCEQSFMKHSRNINKMQEILMETHQNNLYFLELCKNMQIQL